MELSTHAAPLRWIAFPGELLANQIAVNGLNWYALQEASWVQNVVDINTRKQGRYVAGTGHRITAPETLQLSAPDIVIVMNAAYMDEIRLRLESLGIAPEILVV